MAVTADEAVECRPRATTALPSRRACPEGSAADDAEAEEASSALAVAATLPVLLGMRWRRSVSASICWKMSSLSTANSSDESCSKLKKISEC